jgi:hypothetical protein
MFTSRLPGGFLKNAVFIENKNRRHGFHSGAAGLCGPVALPRAVPGAGKSGSKYCR